MPTFNPDIRPARSPFRTPAGYFEQLPHIVASRIAREQSRTMSLSRPLYIRLLPYWGAACVAVLIAIFAHVDSISGNEGQVTASQNAPAQAKLMASEADYAYDYLTAYDTYDLTYDYDNE